MKIFKAVTLFILALFVINVALVAFRDSEKSAQAPAAPASAPTTTLVSVSRGTAGSSKGTTLFSNSDYGFSFKYPSGFSVVPQNFMDTRDHKTLVTLANADKTETIHVSVLLDPQTGHPQSSAGDAYQQALINDVVFDGSGAHPSSFDAFAARQFAGRGFSYVRTGLFEGVLSLSYYVPTPKGIIRFSLVSRGVDWTNPSYDSEQDPGHVALKRMLITFRLASFPG